MARMAATIQAHWDRCQYRTRRSPVAKSGSRSPERTESSTTIFPGISSSETCRNVLLTAATCGARVLGRNQHARTELHEREGGAPSGEVMMPW